ncbi:unnamed protein product [Cuscuta epithymum]|uniref:RING-type E3 ubiquitin transferase n=1 Tax=Cuscuta epithymum TaxID=186058 RepID=A0AAV0G5F3_9ASTE|nr:unnamed protein product [Cuscuta epithymum]
MGGCCCCCAPKRREPNSSSQFYHYPRVSEEQQPLSQHGTALVLTTGRPRTPPGNQDGSKGDATMAQIKNIEPAEEVNSGNCGGLESDTKTLDNVDFTLRREVVVDELEKSGELNKSLKEPIVPSVQEEEDLCPTCLEEYDMENPKIITKCEHHFHLSCILEWMERSDTCPVCDKEMVFSA